MEKPKRPMGKGDEHELHPKGTIAFEDLALLTSKGKVRRDTRRVLR